MTNDENKVATTDAGIPVASDQFSLRLHPASR